MTWTFTRDIDAFAAAAGPFLHAEPGTHTVPLTVLSSLRARGLDRFGPEPPLFGWWDGGGTVVWTPPYFLGVTQLPPEAVAALADVSRTWSRRPDGVTGPRSTARAYACAYLGTDGPPASSIEKRLYVLGTLAPPERMPDGAPRVARAADRPLLVRWCDAFLRDTRPQPADPSEAASMVDDRLSYDGLTVWEDASGTPVSMASRSRTEAGMVRVTTVYTPPDRRGKGYAGAVTTTVTQEGLDDGAAAVVLFADAANATSNALYQRLGYVVADDHADIPFSV